MKETVRDVINNSIVALKIAAIELNAFKSANTICARLRPERIKVSDEILDAISSTLKGCSEILFADFKNPLVSYGLIDVQKLVLSDILMILEKEFRNNELIEFVETRIRELNRLNEAYLHSAKLREVK